MFRCSFESLNFGPYQEDGGESHSPQMLFVQAHRPQVTLQSIDFFPLSHDIFGWIPPFYTSI